MPFNPINEYRRLSKEDILEDIRQCAIKLNKNTITSDEYNSIGKVHSATVTRRFSSWNNALKLAGLSQTINHAISDNELFENLKSVWVALGRQPRSVDIKRPASEFHYATYKRRFGSWGNTLDSFYHWLKIVEVEQTPSAGRDGQRSEPDRALLVSAHRRTRREISDRMRFRILMRDGFTCKSCGSSPITGRNIELHVDHIIPWSKGGETIESNLETKCKRCNLGKGNAFDS